MENVVLLSLKSQTSSILMGKYIEDTRIRHFVPPVKMENAK